MPNVIALCSCVPQSGRIGREPAGSARAAETLYKGAVDSAAVVAAFAAAVTVVGALAAVWATRLAHMAVAVVAVVVGVAGVGLAAGGPALAALLALGGVGLAAPVVAAVVVVDLDGRAGRTLRPWKLLLLVPVPLLALLLFPQVPLVATFAPAQPDNGALLLALLALGAAGPAVLVLVRRRESAAP